MVMKRKELPLDLIHHLYFVDDLSQEEIAKRLGVTQWMISDRMRTAGLRSKARTRNLWQKKYCVDEEAFKSLNPKVAWVLGWLMSDGYVSNDRVFGIKVADKDQDIVFKLRDFLCYDGPIYSQKTFLRATNKFYGEVCLQINSPPLVNDLRLYGIVRGKSGSERFPDLILCSGDEAIIKAFIQGVFEGDGSILLEKETSLVFQIVGTHELLTVIQDLLVRYVRVSKTKLTHNTKQSNHYALRYRGRYNALRIFD
jgi:hypothetical protein